MDPNRFEALLNQFAEGDPLEQHSAMRELLAARKQHAAANDTRFPKGTDRLLDAAAHAPEPRARLTAVAELARLLATVYRATPGPIVERLAASLEQELPPIELLSDADDRAYVADACRRVSHAWSAGYVARGLVVEEAGEASREAFASALFGASLDATEALRLVASEFLRWRPSTDNPADSAIRRLRRVLVAIRNAIKNSIPGLGREPGQALTELIRTATNRGAVSDGSVLTPMWEEVAGVVHEIVRAQFSTAVEPATYSALAVIKSGASAATWEKFASESPALRSVARDVREALLILARQNMHDDALFDALAVSVGSRARARDIAIDIAKLPGLTDAVRDWLATGRASSRGRGERGPEGTALLNENVRIADLMVDVARLRIVEASVRRDVLVEMELLHPRTAKSVERVLNFALSIGDAIDAIGKLRGLQLRGAPGEVEDYAPLEHELVEDVATLPRRVRLVRPVVVHVDDHGVPSVVRTGTVEPLR